MWAMIRVIEWVVTLAIDVAIKLWVAREQTELRVQRLDYM